MKKIKNVIFDLGGVIITLDRERAVRAFVEIGVENADELLDACHQQGIFQEVEDGRLDAEGFRQALSKLTGKELTQEEILKGWLGFLVEVPQYKLDYMTDLRRRGYKVYILSNTNPYVMQWARSNDFFGGKPLDAYADAIVASYEARSMKPDRGIFDALIKETGLIPEESVFLDDGPANVAIGQELGFVCLQPENGADWREALTSVLSDTDTPQ